MAALDAGTPAPDFTLPSTPDQTVSLRDFRGRPVILAFYPADWSPVCGDQMALYNEVLPEFQRYGATLLGVLGALVAIPVAASIQIILKEWWAYRQEQQAEREAQLSLPQAQ